MGKTNPTFVARKNRQARIRRHIVGLSERPRLNIFRSLNHIYAQVIDDSRGVTLAAASSLDASIRDEEAASSKTKKERAALVGKLVAERALTAGITQVVFDRGGYKYHGRVKALAEASREAGLKF
jgi:large subunit ribosomal protein L18